MKIPCSMHVKCERKVEEEATIKAIRSFYPANYLSDIICEPLGQSTSPDYGFVVEGRDIALEVTLSDIGVVIDKSGKKITKNSTVMLSWQAEIENKLKQKIQQWVSVEDTIVLTLVFYCLVEKKIFLKLPSVINQEIETLYYSKKLSTEYTSIEIKNGPTVLIKLAHYKRLPLMFMLKPSNLYLVSLKSKALAILMECIKTKTEKMKNSPIKEKWLAIVNNHPILELEDYKEAYREIDQLKHYFSKIFIISNEAAYEIG